MTGQCRDYFSLSCSVVEWLNSEMNVCEQWDEHLCVCIFLHLCNYMHTPEFICTFDVCMSVGGQVCPVCMFVHAYVCLFQCVCMCVSSQRWPVVIELWQKPGIRRHGVTLSPPTFTPGRPCVFFVCVRVLQWMDAWVCHTSLETPSDRGRLHGWHTWKGPRSEPQVMRRLRVCGSHLLRFTTSFRACTMIAHTHKHTHGSDT